VRTLIKETEKDVIISFNGEASGQFRKDGRNDKLIKLLGDYEFTAFREGIMKTYKWYMENKDLYGK